MKLDDADRNQVINALKRQVNAREGWDVDPEWGHIYRTESGRMRCRAMPVPSGVWRRYGHPANLLGAYRELLASPRGAGQRQAADAVRNNISPAMVGMYLVTEGWAPPAHKAQALYEAELRGERKARYKDMPDRVEVRQAAAVDWDSSMYMVTQPRPTMVLDGAVDVLTDDGVELAGRMPELLYGILMLTQRQPAR